jgi:L-gulonate 5-dehydrogenase
MKSVFMEEPRKVYIKDIERGKRKSGEALIKVKSVGICGSDIGAYRGANPLVKYPTVIGHEIAGEVVEIDPNPKNIKVGDRVILDPYLYCGHCYPCSLKRTNCCENLKVLGVQTEGGMMEYRTHPAQLLYKVSDRLDWEVIPMIEPLCIALHSLKQTAAQKDEHLVVIGAGPIGLLICLAAIIYGVKPILVDILDQRLQFAKTLGVSSIINSMNEDAIVKIRKITNGRMAECVVEASGAGAAIRNTLNYVAYAGRIVLTGWPKEEVLFATGIITKKELAVKGSRTSNAEFDEAIKLITNNVLNVHPLISKVVSLGELPNMISEIDEHPNDFLKVIGMFNDNL